MQAVLKKVENKRKTRNLKTCVLRRFGCAELPFQSIP
jgi:hypothetical protein